MSASRRRLLAMLARGGALAAMGASAIYLCHGASVPESSQAELSSCCGPGRWGDDEAARRRGCASCPVARRCTKRQGS